MAFSFSLVAFLHSPIKFVKIWLLYLLVDILATGPMPKHISFEMDGNRTYAKKLGKAGKEGHPAGFKNLILVCISYTKDHSRSHACPCLGPRALPTPTNPVRDRVRVFDGQLQSTQRGSGRDHEAC